MTVKKSDQVDEKKKMISLFITEEEFERWNRSFKSLGYSTRTNMIKDAVNSLFLPKQITEKKVSLDTSKIENEIQKLRKENTQMKEELLALNRQMLKFLSNGYQNNQITKQITIEQRLIQLLKENPLGIDEIALVLGLDTTSTLETLNKMIEKDLIIFDKEKTEWRVI